MEEITSSLQSSPTHLPPSLCSCFVSMLFNASNALFEPANIPVSVINKTICYSCTILKVSRPTETTLFPGSLSSWERGSNRSSSQGYFPHFFTTTVGNSFPSKFIGKWKEALSTLLVYILQFVSKKARKAKKSGNKDKIFLLSQRGMAPASVATSH